MCSTQPIQGFSLSFCEQGFKFKKETWLLYPVSSETETDLEQNGSERENRKEFLGMIYPKLYVSNGGCMEVRAQTLAKVTLSRLFVL